MARPRKRHVQQTLYLGDKNGQRRGNPNSRKRRRGVKLGRPPKGPRSSERHKARPELKPNQAVHVTLRASDEIGRMRTRSLYDCLRWATIAIAERVSCHIVHLSIQHNHVHLLVEAENKLALARGMQAFQISAARRINVELSNGRSKDVGWWEAKTARRPGARSPVRDADLVLVGEVGLAQVGEADLAQVGEAGLAQVGEADLAQVGEADLVLVGEVAAVVGEVAAVVGEVAAAVGEAIQMRTRSRRGLRSRGAVQARGERWWNAKQHCWIDGRRKGAVFPDRYHEEIIATPRQARNALCYVLNNWRKHREHLEHAAAGWKIDPFSSGWAFGGWYERGDSPFAWKTRETYQPMLTAYPQTWLLREGWRRGGGPISVRDVPGARG